MEKKKTLTKKDMIDIFAPFAKAIQKNIQETNENVLGLKVLVEDADKKWDLIAEQYSDIAERLDRIEARLAKVESSLAAQNEMIASMAVDLNRIKGELEIMRPRLRNKADIAAYESLERRVFALEKRR